MDYGLPKTIPATGAGFFAIASTQNQIIVLLGVMILVFVGAHIIRVAFRRHKALDEK
jgi:hypothetical protein